MLVHEAQIRLKIPVIFEFAGKGQHDLVEVFEGVRAALLIALFLGLDRISRDLLQLTLQLFLLGLTGLQLRLQPLTVSLVPGDESFQPSALQNNLHSPGKVLGHGHFLLGHL